MELVILVIHIILAVGIIGVILLQPPESSSLGGLGGANPMAGANSRGQGNLLTRTTAILATCFIITSLILATLAGHKPQSQSILDEAESSPAMNAPKEPGVEKVPADKTETGTSKPAEEKHEAPMVPLSK